MYFVKRLVIQFSNCNATRTYIKNPRRLPPDPGINLRKKFLNQEQNEEVDEFEDDVESDFMSVHKSHKEYLAETAAQKERTKYLIIKQKYFKQQKLPNFLTWHDKEQIRHLHKTNPEEWTIERLSEGFPALPRVIHKIVSSSWIKTKESKIENHDASVKMNWQLFKKGEMPDLPDELKDHLNKFSNRALILKKFEPKTSEQNVVELKTRKRDEFYNIIKSYKDLKKTNSQQTDLIPKTEEKKRLNNEIAEIPVSSQKLVTFKQLKGKLNTRLEKGSNIDEIDACIVQHKPQEISIEQNLQTHAEVKELAQNKYQESTGLLYHKKTVRDLAHLKYPEKITIPKGIYKHGFTYKLNDCYYDDDGEFLYRVPGMC